MMKAATALFSALTLSATVFQVQAGDPNIPAANL